ncbi:MAG: DUF4491 family protein [Rikenellaceae bacterium]|nr:DUF4491 family protein [Rikenellaceae bacterium]
MELISNFNYFGIIIGVSAFLIIGLFHSIVIKAEYYWGTRCWWIFLIIALTGLAISIISANIIISAIAGVFAFSSLWTIKELFDQKKRVQKGWFPKNPKREKDYV